MPGQALFNPNDNVTGRDGGPYLDEVENRSAEARRAVVEDREPDYDKPGAAAGTPLVTAGRVAGVIGVNNLPSQSHRYDMSNAALVQKRADDEDEPAFGARSEIPGEFDEKVKEANEAASRQAPASTSQRLVVRDGEVVVEDSDDEDSDEDTPDLNSHDPANVGASTESDTDEGEDTGPAALNFDSQYEDDASREG